MADSENKAPEQQDQQSPAEVEKVVIGKCTKGIAKNFVV